ncbi:MAG: M20/M25/M40 family metallo-hydrolase [Corallococcus sp.]|nr:M20/M25/M40 family metallo-hydrolase [Corallococcus sp.]MCM1359430.1 M20/M25/M40 family metallo-hydrolase [Corallococcus sp.]MCM1394758.1 M20/M25/M40 family metallo-hydrolase [Corallococcus sp.]
MKKTLFAVGIAVLLALTLFLVAVVPAVAFATDGGEEYKNTETYKFLADFVKDCPIRSEEEETGSELKAAKYLKEKFEELANETAVGVDNFICYLTDFKVNDKTRHNVVAKLLAPEADKQIVIGAHYDSNGGEGANDNASGVTALYLVMKNLLTERENLPVNVVFVAFGAEELGMCGSENYVSQMSDDEKERTLAMVNFDVIANGDNLYVFCENKHTSLADFVLSNSKGKVKIYEKPYAVGTHLIDINGFGYYETIQNTDFTPFRLAGIPTVAYFSGAYRLWDYVESRDDSKNTMNTDNDTLANLEKNGSLFVERIQSVVTSVTTTVFADGFMEVALSARDELVNNNVWFNIWWPRLAVFAAAAILAIAAVFYLRKLQKNAILGTAEIKNTTVFSSPDSEDIFTFEGDSKSSKSKKSDDVDDIFSFKK